MNSEDASMIALDVLCNFCLSGSTLSISRWVGMVERELVARAEGPEQARTLAVNGTAKCLTEGWCNRTDGHASPNEETLKKLQGQPALQPLHPLLSRSAARLYDYLKNKSTIPTYDDIATDLAMSRNTISAGFKELRAKKLLPEPPAQED